MQIEMREVQARTLLTMASGFVGTGAYTHTLNPYAGCAFRCSYCYMRTFPVQRYREAPWGTWVDVKANAALLYAREAASLRRRGAGLRIFLSSATDPYQPLERRARVTRALLEAMLDSPPDRLTIQTRSPFVVEDLPRLRALSERTAVRVSITIETDRDEVRRVFAPTAPGIGARVRALRTLHDAGIETQAAVSPILPCTRAFPEMLLGVADRVVIYTLTTGDGARGGRSAELGMPALLRAHGWGAWYAPDIHIRAARRFREVFDPTAVHTMAGDL